MIGLIALYQKTLSPDHGWAKKAFFYGFCRFYPSCSDYAAGSFDRFGFLKGSVLSIRRILRCNPFSEPRIDHIPQH